MYHSPLDSAEDFQESRAARQPSKPKYDDPKAFGLVKTIK